ncbi:hypothetical protein Taro_049827 [Colocasia esculenta]|uniref:Uncharacterized protein n=1 Tax=Colocasia esculenta TaxID=4460 RepID=A0A843XC18_COLES|nr:hypothetical protein [Colocasia esculenta]
MKEGDDSRKIPEVEALVGKSLDTCDPKDSGCGDAHPDEMLKACESSSKCTKDTPHDEHVGGSSILKNVALERMKLNMEENGFEYLPPRTRRRSNDYLHYRRKKIDGKLHFLAHTDYYIILRACAKLAQVDARIMHLGVLKLERRLGWLEQRIGDSLMMLLHS